MAWNESVKKELGSCGEGVCIGESVIFTSPQDVHLGDKVRIDPFTLITASLRTGSNIQICSHVVIGGGRSQAVTLEDWTFIGYGSKLFTASEDYSGENGPVNNYWNPLNTVFRGDILFQRYSGVASDVIVMPAVTLPEGCTVGAQSFVYTRNSLTPWSIWIGNPLKFHKTRDRETICQYRV